MTKGWSDERRAAQAARCRANAPWQHATGPRSEGGKKIAAKNAFKHGLYTQSTKAVRKVLRDHAAQEKALTARMIYIVANFLDDIRTERKAKEINVPPPPPLDIFKTK